MRLDELNFKDLKKDDSEEWKVEVEMSLLSEGSGGKFTLHSTLRLPKGYEDAIVVFEHLLKEEQKNPKSPWNAIIHQYNSEDIFEICGVLPKYGDPSRHIQFFDISCFVPPIKRKKEHIFGPEEDDKDRCVMEMMKRYHLKKFEDRSYYRKTFHTRNSVKVVSELDEQSKHITKEGKERMSFLVDFPYYLYSGVIVSPYGKCVKIKKEGTVIGGDILYHY
jgi:hypothetical protein